MAGLLGDNAPQGTGLLGGLENFLLDNNSGLMGFGMGLLSGDTSAAMQGYMNGQRQDFARRQMIAKENEELQKRTAAESIANKMGFDPQVAKADPDGVLTAYRALQVQKMTPREYGMEETWLRNLQKTDPQKFSQIMESKYGPKPASLPADIQTYQYAMQQRQAVGQPVVPFEQWKVEQSVQGEHGKPLPAEIASKFGLADQYFKRFDGIEKDLTSNDPSVVGIWDNTRAQSGVGPGGAIYRDMKLGSEALVRMLTGAGRSESEAAEEARQYLPRVTDTAKDVLDKQKRLRAALRSMQREALRGRVPQDVLDKNYPDFPVEAYPAEGDAKAAGNIGVNRATAAVKGRVIQHPSGATIERID